MQLLQSYLVPLAASSLLPWLGQSAPASANTNTTFCGLKYGPIVSSQSPEGDEFIGTPATANRLHAEYDFRPRGATVHANSANTNSVDYPGPLGQSLKISSINQQLGLFYWDADETMFAVYRGPCNGSNTNIAQAIAILNPETLAFDAVWQPPANSSELNFSYMQLLKDTSEIVVSNQKEGQIFILKKCHDARGKPTIELRRIIDLSTSGILKGYTLLSTGMDTAGNVWFSTGALDSIGDATATNSTIVGYVEPNGTVHSLEIHNQSVGQGMAISNTTVIINSQPSARDDPSANVGFLSALQPGPNTSINVVWNSTYDAGTHAKPGALARGSGTTPALLGDAFVAIADNADSQINLLIYPQNPNTHSPKPTCKLPLFHPNASWTDNNPLVHHDGQNYHVVVQNMHNAPNFEAAPKALNGPHNNLTAMAPGLSQYFVAGNGSGCHLEWSRTDIRTTTVLVLSTETGLMYGFEQSLERAEEGVYVWYVTGMDFETGRTVWKARLGAGGAYNNNLRTTNLGPDGTLYQGVQGGVVVVKDGEGSGGGY